MYRIGEEEMVLCPYNRSHVVSKLRIHKHITKCQKNYPHLKLVTCFYNYSHRIKPESILEHYEICSHKTRLDGARYYESFNTNSSNSSKKNDPFAVKFPDITVKPLILTDPGKLFSSLNSALYNTGQKLDKPSLESTNNCQLEVTKKNEFEAEVSDNSDSDDELEPLPLPKTVSKAFVWTDQKSENMKFETIRPNKFGRGKNFVAFSQPKPSRPDQLLPELSDTESVKQSKIKSPRFFPGVSSCSASVTSSMVDDAITLKSEEVIFDEAVTDDEKSDDDFIMKNFDTYLNL